MIVKPTRDGGRFVKGQHYSTKTQILPGERRSQATEFKRGRRRSPATEFPKGGAAHNRLPVGSVTIRTAKGRDPRAWVKVGEPNAWRPRAIVVWETANGTPLPRGMIVHHIDEDSLNDVPENLTALTRRDHLNEHERGRLSARHSRELLAGLARIAERARELNDAPLLAEIQQLEGLQGRSSC